MDMPNLMTEFLNDIARSSKTVTDLKQLATTSVEIQNTVMGGVRTTKDSVKKLKSGEMLRSLTAWFKQKDQYGEDSSFGIEDEDFDAGFNNHAIEDEPSSTPLSADDMNDIGVGQTREMYRIGQQTYESHLHTSATIINELTKRSSEILSSLGTTQSILKRMDQTLDKIVSIRTSKLAEREKHTSFFDQNGELTFSSVINAAMDQMRSSGKSVVKSVMDKTGLTRLDEMGHAAITDMSNTAFSKLLVNPAFKKLFGDHTIMHGGSDYSSYIVSDYTKEASFFDGQVRKTIIDIIPGYLQAITHALTDTVYHISEYGSLTTEKPLDPFERTIDTTFETKLNRQYADSIVKESNDDNMDYDTIYKLQSILVSQYIFYIYKNGIKVLKEDVLERGGITKVHQHVAIIFSDQTNKRYSYWTKILSYIEARLISDKQYRQSFVRSVNSGFQRLDALAKEVVNSRNVRTTQYTRDMFDQHARDLIGYDAKFAQFEGKTPRQLIKDGLIKQEELPDKYLSNLDQKINSLEDFHLEIRKSSYDTSGNILNDILRVKYAYLNSIFERLNTGINVFVVPWNYKDDEAQVINTQAMVITYPTSTEKVKVEPYFRRPKDDTPVQQSHIVEAVKNNKYVSSVSNALTGEWGRMKSDFTMFKDQAFDAFGDKIDYAILENDADRLSNLGTDQGNKDAETIKAVMSGLQTAVKDGDTQEDLGALKDAASEIEDPEARERINRLIQSTIDRSGKKSKPKSILGKAVLLAFTAFKKAVNFVKSTIGKMLGKYLKWVTKMFSSAGKKIITGGKAFHEGLWGKKDSDQKGLIRDTVAWGKQTASKIWNSNSMKNLREAGGHVADTAKSLTGLAVDKAIDAGKAITGKAKDIGKTISDTTKPILSKIGSGAVNVAGKIGGYGLIAKDTLAKTSFGKGFASAFEKRKKNPEITSTSLFDKRAADISDLVRESTANTFFFTLVSSVREYSESLTDYVDYLTGGGDEEENQKRIQEQRQKREEEKRKKKEEEERKKKEEEDRKKREAEEAAKNKSSAKSTIGFDIGKMTGGLVEILQGIMESVVKVLSVFEGLQAIMGIGEEILKKSLKPLNKVFFQIYKMLKPIVNIITKTLKTIVKTITDIVISIVDVIQPLIEALQPIISSILELLKPILELITGLVDVLIVPLTAVFKVTIVPILTGINNAMKMLQGILQVGFGIMITALGGWLMAFGTIIKWLTGATGVQDTGKQLFTTGTSMVVAGAKSYISGIKGQITAIASNALNIITLGNADNKNEEKTTKPSKKKETALYGSALEGTYGSGDEDPLYSLGTPIRDAMEAMRGTGKKFLNMFMPEDDTEDITNGALSDLQKMAKRVIGIFTGEEDDTVSERLDKASNKQKEGMIAHSAADLTDEEQAAIEATAFENFQKDHPRRSTETNTEYEKRYQKYKSSYVAAATSDYLNEKNRKALAGEDGGATFVINSLTGDDGTLSKFQSGMTQVDDSVKEGGFADIAVPLDGSDSESESGRRGRASQGRIQMTGQLSKGNIWDSHKNKSGVKKFMQTALDAGLTGAQLATVASTGIWEDGGEKLWGSKSLTATTYDVNGQRAQGIMNWVDPNVDYGDTVEEQLQYIQRVYFSPSTNDSRAKVQKNSYWDVDEQGFKTATGRSGFELTPGERYGPAMESDLIEGSEHFFRTALVPACIHTAEGPRKYIGTAVGVYNWLLDEGYIGDDYDDEDYDDSSSSNRSSVLSGNSTEEKIYRYLTSKKGMSGIGAAGMMGCMKYESDMKSNNLENTFNSQFGMTDEQYTSAVDNKSESKKNFMYGRYATYISGQTPGEAVGYGLTQFTSSALKKQLYENTVEKGKSIADVGAQLDAVVDTLKGRKVGSMTLFDKIKTSASPTKANQWFLWRYEAGTGYNSDEAVARAYSWMGMQGINDRHNAAERYYEMYGTGPDDEDYVDTDDYPVSYVESIQDELMSQADQQDYIFDGIEEADIEPLVGNTYIPPLDQSALDAMIPTLTPITTQSSPIVINQFVQDGFDLNAYIGDVLVNEYNVQSSRIQELVDGIFEELPEYLEDDDDDDYEFTDEDDRVIQQLASAFL